MKKELLKFDFCRRFVFTSAVALACSGLTAAFGDSHTSLFYSVAAAQEVSVNPVRVLSTNPADGSTVVKLSQINLELAGAVYPEIGYDYVSGYNAVAVTDANGTEVQVGGVRNSGGTDMIKLKSAVTEPGTYTVTLKAGSIWSINEMMEKIPGTENEEVSFTYTIVDMEAVTFNGATPPSGSALKSISSINLDLSGGDPNIGIEFAGKEFVTIEDEAGNVVGNANIRNMRGTYVLKPTEEITAPGAYTITVSKGALYAVDYMMEKVVGTENSTFYLSYTVVDTPAVSLVSSDPENGSTVESLKEILTVWEGGEGLVLNAPKSDIEVINSDFETVATVSVEEAEGGIRLTLSQEINAEGKYSFSLPSGIIQAVDTEGKPIYGNVNESVYFSYVVSGGSDVDITNIGQPEMYVSENAVMVNGIENAHIQVYDLSGRLIKDTMSSMVYLPSGLYIVKACGTNGTITESVIIR